MRNLRKLFFIAVLAVAAMCLVNCSKDNGEYGSISGLVIAINDGKTGYFTNSNGEMLFGKQFEAVKPFSEGLAAVKVDGKWGFIDTDGNTRIFCSYGNVGSFSDGMVWVKDYEKDKYGYLDNTGRTVIACNYEYVTASTSDYDFIDGFAVVCENNKYSLIDKMGTAVLKDYDNIVDNTGADGFDKEFVLLRKDGKCGYYNKNTKAMITPEYEDASSNFSPGSNGMAYVKWGGKWGFIDKSGKKVIQNNYYGADYYSESDDLAPVMDKDYHWGFIDRNGTLKIPYKYHSTERFCESLVAVLDTTYNKWGFIDRDDRTVLSFVYSGIKMSFVEGISIIKKGNYWGVINKSGAAVIPFKYSSIVVKPENLSVFKVCENGAWGLIDRNGREIISPMYSSSSNIDWSFL